MYIYNTLKNTKLVILCVSLEFGHMRTNSDSLVNLLRLVIGSNDALEVPLNSSSDDSKWPQYQGRQQRESNTSPRSQSRTQNRHHPAFETHYGIEVSVLKIRIE